MMRCNAVPYEGRDSYIFVSYCHEDEARVYPLIESMVRDGCRIWFDEGIIPGDEWQETIANHLAGCDLCIAVISEKSLSSHNCRREINYAIQRNKTIISLFLDDVRLSPGMEMALSNVQGLYASRFATAEDLICKLYENPAVAQCRGNRRPNLEVNPFVDDNEMDKTLTLTVGITTGQHAMKENFLYRIRTGEKINIENNNFSVGRSREQADYAIEGNKTISRNHATIRHYQDSYYIVDNDSLNHTIVNSKVLDPWIETEITGGDAISLGKELFVFFKNYSEKDLVSMPEHTLTSGMEDILVPNEPIVKQDRFVIMNTGRAYYVINAELDKTVYHNGERLFYGEKRRLQNGDEIVSDRKTYTWRIAL